MVLFQMNEQKPTENMAKMADMKEWNGLPTPRRHWAIAAIWLGMAMAVLDGAIANVALPAIARDIHASPAESIWVVNAYQLAIVVSLLPMAALGEIAGYRRVYQAGLLLFVVASFACTQVHTLLALAAARGFQGFGAAGVMSINGALVRYTFPHSTLGRAIGYNAVVISICAAIGPTVASTILSLGSWQWLFAVNIPIGLASLAIGWATLPESPKSGHALDLVSTMLNVATFGLVIIGADMLTRGGVTWIGWGELAIGFFAAALLVRRSLSQRRPLVPIDLLRNRVFSLSVLTSVASFSAQMLAFVALPFFIQNVMHRSQVETGLLMTPWPVAVGIAAPIAGRLADRFPAAIMGAIGLAIFSAGLLLLAFLPGDASTLDIGWRMMLCGLGFGFFQSPNNRTLLSAAPLDRSGAAAGMLATSRLTGQTLGASLAAVIFRVAMASEMTCLIVAAAFAALAAAASLSRLEYKSV
ncbi:MAG TPA: MFS transporter [Rhizomicrobium sp.]|nr:MFS transporter [Rhizomicrobium sp.]